MTVRELHDAIQRGDLSVLSEVADVLSELADVIDWLKEANWVEQREAVAHIQQLDLCCYRPEINFSLISDNVWF